MRVLAHTNSIYVQCLTFNFIFDHIRYTRPPRSRVEFCKLSHNSSSFLHARSCGQYQPIKCPRIHTAKIYRKQQAIWEPLGYSFQHTMIWDTLNSNTIYDGQQEKLGCSVYIFLKKMDINGVSDSRFLSKYKFARMFSTSAYFFHFLIEDLLMLLEPNLAELSVPARVLLQGHQQQKRWQDPFFPYPSRNQTFKHLQIILLKTDH